MILVDANLLIYAVDSDSAHHAFLRITTRPGILRRPLDPEHAIEFVDSWLAQPYVQAVAPGDGHWAVLRQLVRAVGTAGNLTSDAHLAAMALERGCDVYSTDGDFARFPGVRHVNPIA